MKQLNVKLLFIQSILTILFIEISSRIFFPQALSTSWRVLNSDGLLVNRKNSSALHQGFQTEIIKYEFGNLHNRISKNEIESHNKCKYLVLGDSFTFGWLVNYEQTFVNLIEKKINANRLQDNRISFLNSASPGYGIADYVSFIEGNKSNLQKFNGVILFINASDAWRATNSKLFTLDKNSNLIEQKNYSSHKSTQGFFKRKSKKFVSHNKINKIYKLSLKKSNFLRLLRNTILLGKIPQKRFSIDNQVNYQMGYNKKDSIFKNKDRQKLVRILERLAIINKDFIPITLVYIGTGDYKYMTSTNKTFLGEWGQAIMNRNNLPYDFSLNSVSPILSNNELIKGDGHPNEEGHKKLSYYLLKSNNVNGTRKFINKTCKF